VEGGVYSRFLPEFMKPRAARCSIDQPKWWTWKAYDPHAKEVNIYYVIYDIQIKLW
jgi:hypothetical protein